MIARVLRHPLAWLYAWFLIIPFLMTATKSTVSLGTEIVIESRQREGTTFSLVLPDGTPTNHVAPQARGG